MIKDIKKLKELLKLREKSEAQMRDEGFTTETLKGEIKKFQDNILKELNVSCWVLMFLIFIPLALMQLGLKWETAFMISYFSGGIIAGIILPKLFDRHY